MIEEPVDDITEVEEEEEELEETEETEEEIESEVPEEDEDEEVEEEELEEEEEVLETKEKRHARKEKDELEEDLVEERFYTIPLRKAWISTRKKRAPRAGRIVKSYVLKHMKVRTEADEEEEEPEKLVIDNEVNEKLWSRGIEKPPRKIRVRVIKDKEGVVTVLLAEGD
jgi:large subunit ribosomal protein L31e